MDVNDLETADGSRFVMLDGQPLRGTFPKHWGKPPDDLEERQRWMVRNIKLGEERLNHGEVVEGQRPKTGRQALAALRRKRSIPADANHIREQILERSREGPQ